MTRRRMFANRLMTVGAVLVLLSVILLLYNLNRDWDAKNSDFEILSELDEAVQAQEIFRVPKDVKPEFPDDMDSVNIDDVDYVGYITIPALGVELPVTKTWSYEKLKLSPCRYAGNVTDGNLVICAHNYRSHFGRLPRLTQGEEVRFKDVHGNVTHYQVTASSVLAPTAIEKVTLSDADLTLFTCTYGGRTRYTVQCAKRNDIVIN